MNASANIINLTPKKVFSVVKLSFFAASFLVLSACVPNEVSTGKFIDVLLGCENADSYNDLLYSIEGITKLSTENSIKVNVKNNDKRCGYLLVWNSEKYIAGVLTDYDLMIEVKAFFKL